jgi:hypothetical protein
LGHESYRGTDLSRSELRRETVEVKRLKKKPPDFRGAFSLGDRRG